MESWRLVLRDGFLWQWPTDRLGVALELLEADSPKLLQGATSSPPPLMVVQDWACEACDLIAFCSTPDALTATVGEVEEDFARACFQADQKLGEPAACRWFLNFWDDTPRHEAFRLVAEEIRDEIKRRVQLPNDLKAALAKMPDDLVLKRACFDWLLENGASNDYAQTESGWGGRQ